MKTCGAAASEPRSQADKHPTSEHLLDVRRTVGLVSFDGDRWRQRRSLLRRYERSVDHGPPRGGPTLQCFLASWHVCGL